MSRPGDFDYLLGKHINLCFSAESTPETYVLDQKLSEDYQNISQKDYEEGLGQPFAAVKFAGHHLLHPAEQAFLRIYAQIPVEGTLRQPPEVRAEQAIGYIEPTELKALLGLHNANCNAVPKFLGMNYSVQGQDDYVPGGYICTVGWARVAGEPVDIDAYWKAEIEYREDVRAAFRPAIEELVRCGWEPWFPAPSNLIYDSLTKTIHMAGFRRALPARTEVFSDMTYANWGLVKPSDRMDWKVDSSDWTW